MTNDCNPMRQYKRLRLNPYQYRLKAYFHEIGVCYKKTDAIAEETQMSVGMVSKTRQQLEDLGLIIQRPMTISELKERGLFDDVTTDGRRKIYVVTCVHDVNVEPPSVHHMNAVTQSVHLMNAAAEEYADLGEETASVHVVKQEVLNSLEFDSSLLVSGEGEDERATSQPPDDDFENQPIEVFRGFGMKTLAESGQRKLAARILAHPYWKAFVRGWGTVPPTLALREVEGVWQALQALESVAADENHIAGCTAEQLKKPRKGAYSFQYLPEDLPPYLIRQRNIAEQQAKKAQSTYTPLPGPIRFTPEQIEQMRREKLAAMQPLAAGA